MLCVCYLLLIYYDLCYKLLPIMTKPQVFLFEDYKSVLHSVLKDQAWGAVSKLAQAAGCQRSYLSRVLNQEIHLTPDQAFKLCQHWEMADDEQKYFLLLLEKDRASDPNYKRYLERQLMLLKKNFEDLKNRVERPTIATEQSEWAYFSNWMPAALHLATSVPNLQTLDQLVQRFHLHPEVIKHVMKNLEKDGFVQYLGNNKWKYKSGARHIPLDSPLLSLHAQNWRLRALQSHGSRDPNEIHYTLVQSMSLKAAREIKSRLSDIVAEVEKIAGPSKEEEMFSCTLDFFKC